MSQPVVVQRDFLAEIAKAVDLLEKVGVFTKEINIVYSVTEKEYHNICSELIRRKVINEIPPKELRLNFSGVFVTFSV